MSKENFGIGKRAFSVAAPQI